MSNCVLSVKRYHHVMHCICLDELIVLADSMIVLADSMIVLAAKLFSHRYIFSVGTIIK